MILENKIIENTIAILEGPPPIPVDAGQKRKVTQGTTPVLSPGAAGAEETKIGKERALEILHKYKSLIAQKRQLNIPDNPRFLGAGSNGAAFSIGNNIAIKITTDQQEALASERLKKYNNLKHVVHVYDVFRFKELPVYCIVQEELKPIAGTHASSIDMFPGIKHHISDALELNNALKKLLVWAFVQKAKYNPQETEERIKKFIFQKVKSFPDQSKRTSFMRSASQALFTLKKYKIFEIMQELHSVGIGFHDYHVANIMQRTNGDPVMIDIGVSKVAGAQEPDVLERKIVESIISEIDFSSLPVDAERDVGNDEKGNAAKQMFPINKHLGGKSNIEEILKANAQSLMDKKKIFVNQLKPLGAGTNGIAFDMGAGKVLKITADEKEAKTSNLLKEKGQNLAFVCKIYDVFQFKNTPGATGKVYAIEQERLTPLSNQEKNNFNELVGTTAKPGPLYNEAAVEALGTGNYQNVLNAIKKMEMDRINNLYNPQQNKKQVVNVDTSNGLGNTGIAASQTVSTGLSNTSVQKGSPFSNQAVVQQKNTAPRKKSANILSPEERNLKNEKQVDVYIKTLDEKMKHFNLDKILPELQSLGIKFADFHGDNMLKRGNTYVIADLGRSDSLGQEPPLFEMIFHSILKEYDGMGDDGLTIGGDNNPMSRNGSSAWSSPHDMINPEDCEEGEGYWQNQLVNMQPIGISAKDE